MDVVIAKITSIASAIFGSALSLYFQKNKITNMKKLEITFVFISGVYLGHMAGSSIIEYWNISHESFIGDLIKFTVALFGMGILSQATL